MLIQVSNSTSSISWNYLLAINDDIVWSVRIRGKYKYLVCRDFREGKLNGTIVNTIHLIVDGETLLFEAYLLSAGNENYYYCTLQAEMASNPMFDKNLLEKLMGNPIYPYGSPIIFKVRK